MTWFSETPVNAKADVRRAISEQEMRRNIRCICRDLGKVVRLVIHVFKPYVRVRQEDQKLPNLRK